MKKCFLVLITLGCILISCQEVVDADKLLDTEEKVLIVSYLSPNDTILRVHVSKALPSIGTPLSVTDNEANENKFLIKNASVSISNNDGESIFLEYSDDLRSYISNAENLSIETGQEYFLNVMIDGRVYNASCTIPKKVLEINETITVDENNEFGGEFLNININFQDIEGERNFYAMGGKVLFTQQLEGEEPFEGEFSLLFEPNEFVTDNLADGILFNGSTGFFIGDSDVFTTSVVTLQVINMEEVLYDNLQATLNNEDVDGDPFIEYRISPNNILDEGAIGVFAGYNMIQKSIELQ